MSNVCIIWVKNLKFKKLWIGILILILLSPIGLILPELLRSTAAWGEWGIDEIEKVAGYMPQGLKKLSELWKAPIPDYSISGWKGFLKGSIAYYISGIVGVGIVAALAILIGKSLAGKNGNS